MYGKNLQSLSSVVQYDVDGIKYGIVYCYLRLFYNRCLHENCNCQYQHCAIIREIKCDSEFQVQGNIYTYNTSGYIYKCHETNHVKAIAVESVKTPCLYMTVDQQSYTYSCPNE